MTDPAPPPGLTAGDVEQLFLQMERPLFNVVYRWLWDRDESAELVQETFARLWQARARVRPDTAGAFVYRIAVNLAASRRRWRALRRFVALDDSSPDLGVQPDLAILGAERAAAVRAAVDALPEKLRRVLVLCELSDLTYADVAAALEIPVGTVGSRRHAAAEQVRRHLQAQEHRREATVRR
ncbi:RNA polymerase sigma factor [Nannocystis bainbridge]|uniref:RNA polymerase sigma factor n=1 Tax=Nannocystis bainbridge TaxID=2995303 RepID=A0ABT5E396_9BACT|nr:RNA polymerase sigma factor [Nannocystis bainbridge]MDC0720225.1 RNA polymerase sigma factor [Nannocystis bainbridge]